jgi:hypothetical protein
MSHVVKVQAALTGILERAYDRTLRAINDSRSGTYTSDQFYKDSADAFVDGVYGTLLPILEFLPFDFEKKPSLPVAKFEFTTAADQTLAIPLLDPIKVTSVDWTKLTLTGTLTSIAKSKVEVKIATNELIVKVLGSSIPASTKLGIYNGEITGTSLAPAPVVAEIAVHWYVF